MSLDGALFTATSGLRHTSRQLALSSHNISNAGTEGYSRKTAGAESITSGGVRTLEQRRDVDLALRGEARGARGQAAALELRSATLGPIARLQGDPEDGRSLGGLVGALRDTLTDLRADPGGSAAQGQALQAAEDVADRLRAVAGALSRARQEQQDGMAGDVTEANALLREVARHDRQVREEVAAGRTGTDALDRRDAAIARLSTLIDVHPIPSSVKGSITLVMGGSTVLPLDENRDMLKIGNAVVAADSTPGILPALEVNGRELPGFNPGGRIGERFLLRDETIPRMQAEVDTLASVLATRLDEQGLRLFTKGDGTSAPPAAGTPGAIGFAAEIRVAKAVTDNPALLRDGTPGAAGYTAPTGVAGYTELLDRVLTYGFGDKPGPGTATHPPIPGGGLGPGGLITSRFSPPLRIVDYAAAVAGSHSAEAGSASRQAEEASGYLTHLGTLLQAREGVDVDQEMAAMVQLQNAYAANARVMSAVQGMWDALLGSVR